MAQKNQKFVLLMDLDSVNGIDSEADNDKKSGVNDFLNYLENRYGKMVFRIAYADWNNGKLRRTAMDLQRSGIVMKHIIRGKGKNNNTNSGSAALLFDAMEFLNSNSDIDSFVLVSSDSIVTALLPYLKGRGICAVGVARDSGCSNSFTKQFDEFLYITDHGLSQQPRKNSDKNQLISFFKQHISSDGIKLEDLEDAVKKDLPDFNPSDYGCSDLSEYLTAMNQVKFSKIEDGVIVSWQPNLRNASAYTNEELQTFSFAEYMQATRWFILDGGIRDRVLHNIYTIFEDGTRILTNDELRNLVDPDHIIEDRPWHGTIYSLVYGACLWENPDSADYKLPRKRLSLFRTVKSEEEFLIRYYTSLFHKAYVERPEITPRLCAELMHPNDVDGHVELYEQVLAIMKEKK
ncbi:MAG: NYN domain-containing protein [Lentisphaeria bacterium]